MKRKIISILLIILLLQTTFVTVFAETAQQKKDNLEEELNNVEEEKEKVTAEKNEILDEISELNSKISKYEGEIDNLNSKISNLEKSIKTKQEEIEKLEKEVQEKQELLTERLVALYQAGETTYLDLLLSSEDLTGFLSNYYMINQLAEADTNAINEVENKQTEVEKTKRELEEQKNEVSLSKKEVEVKTQNLENAKYEKQAKVSELSEEEQKLQQQIEEFEAAIEEAEEEIRREAQNASSSGGSYVGSYEGNLSWPVSSSSPYYNHISSYFGPRPSPTAGASTNHGAVDIPISYQPVYAPADGKVIIARWLSGYGNYVLIDHGDEVYTGFGHLSDFNVSKGDVVSRGQQIATSGNTGITTGPHLHYEVHIGGYDNSDRVDPIAYTTHPSLIYW